MKNFSVCVKIKGVAYDNTENPKNHKLYRAGLEDEKLVCPSPWFVSSRTTLRSDFQGLSDSETGIVSKVNRTVTCTIIFDSLFFQRSAGTIFPTLLLANSTHTKASDSCGRYKNARQQFPKS